MFFRWIECTFGFVLLLILASGLAVEKVYAAKLVEFQTSDGVNIHGSLFPPENGKSPVPAILLLHQLGKDKSSWNAFAAKLAGKHYAVLAIDLRGHGDSLEFGDEIRRHSDFSESEWPEMIEDVRAAITYLKSRKEVNEDRIAIIGASIGANATIVCCNTIGRYAFVGAGAVVTRDVPDHALVVGNPARQLGWMCACGVKLIADLRCDACGEQYMQSESGLVPLKEMQRSVTK